MKYLKVSLAVVLVSGWFIMVRAEPDEWLSACYENIFLDIHIYIGCDSNKVYFGQVYDVSYEELMVNGRKDRLICLKIREDYINVYPKPINYNCYISTPLSELCIWGYVKKSELDKFKKVNASHKDGNY